MEVRFQPSPLAPLLQEISSYRRRRWKTKPHSPTCQLQRSYRPTLFRFSTPVVLETEPPRYATHCANPQRPLTRFLPVFRHNIGYKRKKRVERESSATRLFAGAMYRA